MAGRDGTDTTYTGPRPPLLSGSGVHARPGVAAVPRTLTSRVAPGATGKTWTVVSPTRRPRMGMTVADGRTRRNGTAWDQSQGSVQKIYLLKNLYVHVCKIYIFFGNFFQHNYALFISSRVLNVYIFCLIFDFF